MNNTRKKARRFGMVEVSGLVLAALSAGSVSPAFAQGTGESVTSDEVVVTARRREENLQDIPIAVTAITAETMAAQSIQNLQDIENSTPSLTIRQSFGGATNSIVGLRGQINTASTMVDDPSVGLYFGDVYLGRSPGSLLNFFDTERVEVLAGPQGTLYGRNTNGGAVRIIPRLANSSAGVDGFVRAGVGSFDLRVMEGAVNLPLIQDVFAIRVGISSTEQEGYTTTYVGQRDITPPFPLSGVQNNNANGSIALADTVETDDTDQLSYRVSAVWNITSRTDLTLGYDWNETCCNGQLVVNQTHGATVTAPNLFDQIAPAQGFYEGWADAASVSTSETSGYFTTLNHEFSDNLSGKVIYAHREQEAVFSQDSDGGVGGSVDSISSSRQQQDSVELQLTGVAMNDRLNYTGGIFWFREEGGDITFVNAFINNALFPSTIGRSPFITYDADEIVNESQSAYVNLDFSLTERLGLQLGARHTQDEKSMIGRNRFLTGQLWDANNNEVVDPGDVALNTLCLYTQFGGISPTLVQGTGANCFYPQSNSWNNTSWLVGLDFDITDDVLLYGHASTGFRSGGFSARGANPVATTPFDPEEVTDYEIGLKGDYFDGRVRLNLAAFFTETTGLQRTQSINTLASIINGSTAIPSAFPGTRVFNAGDSEVLGFEASGNVELTDNFDISFTANTLDIEMSNPATVLSNTPEMQYSVGAQYTIPTSFGGFVGRVDFSHRDDIYPSGADNTAVLFGAVDLVNARLTINIDQWDTSVALWARNLTDEEYYESGFFRVGAPSAGSANSTSTLHPGAPQMVGLEFTKNF